MFPRLIVTNHEVTNELNSRKTRTSNSLSQNKEEKPKRCSDGGGETLKDENKKGTRIICQF